MADEETVLVYVYSDVWQKVSSFVPGTTCKVRNLKEGKPYDFRVCAENQYGVSEPLMTTSPIIAKNPFSKLLRKNLCDSVQLISNN